MRGRTSSLKFPTLPADQFCNVVARTQLKGWSIRRLALCIGVGSDIRPMFFLSNRAMIELAGNIAASDKPMQVEGSQPCHLTE
jgi:hypothetical protein